MCTINEEGGGLPRGQDKGVWIKVCEGKIIEGMRGQS